MKTIAKTPPDTKGSYMMGSLLFLFILIFLQSCVVINPGQMALKVKRGTLDDKIFVAGSFTFVNGESRKTLVRLNQNGTLDSSFLVDIDKSVETIVIQNDGKILLGGKFETVNGITQKGISRLNSNGTLDATFNTGSGAGGGSFQVPYVSKVIVLDSGKIIARSTVCAISGLDAIRIPSREDLVIHSMTHLVHEGELHNGLRDLYDIDGMLRSFSVDPSFWVRLTNFSVTNDLASHVLFGLTLVQMVFSTPVPAQVLAELSANSGHATPSGWLKVIYAKALPADRAEGATTIASIARSFIYVRAHAMRMPVHMLARHLLFKAWMRMFATSSEQNQQSQ